MLSVLHFPYSAQVVFVLFVSSHSIIWRHQFQGYQIEKKRYTFIVKRERDGLSPVLQINPRNIRSKHLQLKYWLNIRKKSNSVNVCMRHCIQI